MFVKNFIKKQMTVKKLSKIIKTKILCLVFFIPVFSYSAWQGSGTETDPWQITSRQCLEALADSVNRPPVWWSLNKHFILMNDITDTVRKVIGNSASHLFRGHFDGQNHLIILGIFETNIRYVGLFGYADGATIKNIEVDGYVIATNANHCGAGGVVGYALKAKIENCINRCYVYASAPSFDYAGGIVGMASGSFIVTSIINCRNYGVIEVDFSDAGGIVGYAHGNTSVVNCKNMGNIYAGRYNSINPHGYSGAGGIVGASRFINTISNNLNLGSVSGSDNGVGGIIGHFHQAGGTIVSNNLNYGFIKSAKNNVGGIVGYAEGYITHPIHTILTISNNFNSGIVVGNQNVGCIVGLKGTGTNIINNHYDKQMCGEE